MISSGLFVADVPQYLTDEQFQNLWTNVPGLIEARLRRDKKDRVVGFVDFVDEAHAVKARDQFQGFSFDAHHEHGISIHFTKSNPTRRRSTEDDEYSGSMSSSSNSPRLPAALSVTGDLEHLSLSDQLYKRESSSFSRRRASVDSGNCFPSTTGGGSKAMPVPQSTLYVEGIPTDASEREVAHVFRPFPGFNSLRLFEKSGRKGNYTLCFVEFDNTENATHALHTLQGYKFDHKHDIRGIAIRYARQRSGSVSNGAPNSPNFVQNRKELGPNHSAPISSLHTQLLQHPLSHSSSSSTGTSVSTVGDPNVFSSPSSSTDPLASPGFGYTPPSQHLPPHGATSSSTSNPNPAFSPFDDRYRFDPTSQSILPAEFQKIFQSNTSGGGSKAESMW